MSGERWPNLFVVGVARAGTTSLWSYLGQHPEIYMSPIKETHFLASWDPKVGPVVNSEASYLKLFAGTTERLRGEASVSYFWDREAPVAIKRHSPDAWIVISLRDPVERAFSMYLFDLRYRAQKRTFLEAVEAELATPRELWADHCRYVGRGLYSDRILRYRSLFGERVIVLFYEELAADTRAEMARLYERLGVDPGVAEQIRIEVQNPFSLPRNAIVRKLRHSTRARRAIRRIVPMHLRPRVERAAFRAPAKPAMDERARIALTDAYAPEIERLRQVVGRPLPW